MIHIMGILLSSNVALYDHGGEGAAAPGMT